MVRRRHRVSNTQVASVTAPASSNGRSVTTTSPIRRSTKAMSTAMESNEMIPARRKARTIVRADSMMMIGVPVASGAAINTSCVKRRSDALSCDFGNA